MVEEKIPEGYKKTEEGYFPVDWYDKKVGNLVKFSGGSQPPRSTFKFEKKEGYIRLIQIRDYKADAYATFIPENLANKKCTKEDIMIGRYGPPIFQILRGIEGAYNVALLKASPSNELNKEYLYYFLKQDKLFRFIELLSQRSSGQTGVDIVALREYPFHLPPLPEQKAIAEVLSDTDSLISSLEKLIEKKKKIKIGAMQELLTGEKRLPGFNGKWELTGMGSISSITMGQSPPSSFYNSEYQGLPLIQGNADIENRKTVVRVYTSSITKKCYAGDIIMSVRAPVGKVAKATFESCIGRGVCSISYKNEYLYYYLMYIEESWSRLSKGSTFDSINSSDVKELEIEIPIDEQEQEEIAKIFIEMDKEIETLEQKLQKYKSIKQGMMNDLLTGKIRLLQG